jgi:hypothetical protein
MLNNGTQNKRSLLAKKEGKGVRRSARILLFAKKKERTTLYKDPKLEFNHQNKPHLE